MSRLTDEEVKYYKELIEKSIDPRPASRQMVEDLFDTVEAQEQEIEQLKVRNEANIISLNRQIDITEAQQGIIQELTERCEDWEENHNIAHTKNKELREALKVKMFTDETVAKAIVENRQLKADVATLRDVLEQVRVFVWSGNCTDAEAVINHALSTNTGDYHNPADVEALKLAREALVKAKRGLGNHVDYLVTCSARDSVEEALVVIDAIGGQENERQNTHKNDSNRKT